MLAYVVASAVAVVHQGPESARSGEVRADLACVGERAISMVACHHFVIEERSSFHRRQKDVSEVDRSLIAYTDGRDLDGHFGLSNVGGTIAELGQYSLPYSPSSCPRSGRSLGG